MREIEEDDQDSDGGEVKVREGVRKPQRSPKNISIDRPEIYKEKLSPVKVIREGGGDAEVRGEEAKGSPRSRLELPAEMSGR